MKPIYCTESQDRIPPEFFKLGKAVWSGGRAYLKVHADRLGLKPDPAPPLEYAEALGQSPPKPVPPPPPPEASKRLPDSVMVGSTIHGPTPPIKNPLLASTVAPTEKTAEQKNAAADTPYSPVVPFKNPPQAAAPAPAATPNAPPLPPAMPSAPTTVPAKPIAQAEIKPPSQPKPTGAAKIAPPVSAPAPKPEAAPVAAAAKPAPAQPGAIAAGKSPASQPAKAPSQPAPAAAAVKPAAPAAPAAAAKPAAPVPGAKVVPAAPAPAEPKKKEAPEVKIELEGEKLSIEEMASLPILEGIPIRNVELLYGGIVRRRFKKGQIICLEGQYASTAFYIVSGKAEVYINTPVSKIMKIQGGRAEKRGGFRGFFQKIKAKLEGRKCEPDAGLSEKNFIPTDFADLDLPLDNPVAEMNAGDLFGEMSCLNFYPRSATVRAKEDCEMFEMIRTVLDTVKKSPKSKFKEKLDKQYRTRALEQHLRSIPLLKNYVDESIINQLRYKVELLDFDPGDIIIKQGDAPDAFYLIRRGCVKVSQSHPGGEIVLTYLGRSESFGEIGLVKNTPRTATCTALDHVEVVKIDKRDFNFILDTYEELKTKMQQEAERRLERTREITTHAPATPLDEYLEQGLMQAQSLLLLDLEKCTRCDECVRGCADSHGGVTRLVREGLRFDKYLVATSCRSCMDPVCMIGCPVGSIRRKESMEIIIEDWCIGCVKCANQCPYGNISMHDYPLSPEEQKKAEERDSVKVAEKAGNLAADAKPMATPAAAEKVVMKKAMVKTLAVTCDLCTELPEPNCVYACPHDAAHRVDARLFFEMGAEESKKKAKA